MAVDDVLVANHVGENQPHEWTERVDVSGTVLIKNIRTVYCLTGMIFDHHAQEDQEGIIEGPENLEYQSKFKNLHEAQPTDDSRHSAQYRDARKQWNTDYRCTDFNVVTFHVHPVILEVGSYHTAWVPTAETSNKNTEPQFEQEWAKLHSNRDNHEGRSDTNPTGEPVHR